MSEWWEMLKDNLHNPIFGGFFRDKIHCRFQARFLGGRGKTSAFHPSIWLHVFHYSHMVCNWSVKGWECVL